MYTESARFYDAIYENRDKDYGAESAILEKHARDVNPTAKTWLDVACGTGLHIEQLAQRGFTCGGLDLDASMIEIARARCPGVPFQVGDMLDFALEERFDAVTCMFGAVAYLRTPERLAQAIANLARHVASGGALIVEPWVALDDWREGTLYADFIDRPQLKLARMTRSPAAAPQVAIDFEYLAVTPSGTERLSEHHVFGLFKAADYSEAFRAAGLSFEALLEPRFSRGLYLGREQPR